MKPRPAGRATPRHEEVRTTGGHVIVGRLALGDRDHPARRIFVDLGDCPGCHGTRWAGLTVTEARQLARALFAQASAARQEGGVPSQG
jgi:hypothetical protein